MFRQDGFSQKQNAPLSDDEISDRRKAARVRTVYFVAKVERDNDVGLFVVRNISDTGLMLRAHVEFEVGARVSIFLSDTVVLPGEVVWFRNDCCGVKFDRRINCAFVLQVLEEEKRKALRGSLRIPISRLATCYSEAGIRTVTITDVSQHGVGFSHDGSLRRDMIVKLVLETGLEQRGTVCWSKDGRAGLLLAVPFTCEVLESAKCL